MSKFLDDLKHEESGFAFMLALTIVIANVPPGTLRFHWQKIEDMFTVGKLSEPKFC